MQEVARSSQVVRFGVFEADLRAGELRKNGLKIKLQEQPFQILAMLLARSGEVVTREEVRQKLWPGDTFVDFDNSLNAAVNKLRVALQDDTDNPRFIETLPRRGYRFIAPVDGMERGTEGGPRTSQQAGKSAPPRRTRTVGIAIAALFVLVFGGIIWFINRPQPESPLPPMRTVPLTSFPGLEEQPALSPDGNQVAFSWDGEEGDNFDIYVQLIGAGRPLRLTTDPAAERRPVWSPDGRHIAFLRDTEEGRNGEIFTVPALGGPERKIYSLCAASMIAGLSWSPDGEYLAYLERPPVGEGNPSIFLVSVKTLEKRRLTQPPSDIHGDDQPAFSRDGKTLAFVRRSAATSIGEIYLIPVEAGEPRRLTFDNRHIHGLDWTADGSHIVFSSDRGGSRALWKVAVSGGELELVPLVLAGPPLSPSISQRGNRLAYQRRTEDVNTWRIEVPSPTQRPKPPIRLIASSGWDAAPQISPDGRKIVFSSRRSGSFEIWVCNSDGSDTIQLTSFSGPLTGSPSWSPDGREIVFDSEPEGNADIYVISADGGVPRRLTTEDSRDVIPRFSRDGQWIYFSSQRSGTMQVWKMPAKGGEAIEVTRKGGVAAVESFDGRFLYYAKGLLVSGLWRVPVEGGEEVPVLEGLQARLWGYWGLAEDGVYYVDPDAKAIKFLTFATGQVKEITRVEKDPFYLRPGFAVSPDGRWFLYAQRDQLNQDIMLVENFR